ncbi:HGL126Cp [Eremothecium sinecaudum]|uniref:HGL126Cp n=1 Tax=Eremothecium sinecaudum TaxID=45286 RepID=A0A0X8HVD7_9SACH|nr:HGL126Cp [Eremothecium sinecaudum]AMD22214.1 HGL126Cp [Eremothecium sinecaudum]
MANAVFNVAVFFVVFRECLEAVLVIAILLSFVDRAIKSSDASLGKRLKTHIWVGVGLGFLICLIIGGAFIGAYYSLKKDLFGSAEELWEGCFCLIASIMISMMGLGMLRVQKMQEKWRVKIAKALVDVPSRKRDRLKLGYWGKKYALFLLPFITVLREGLEGVVFVAGAGMSTKNAKASSYPLPAVVGLLAGGLVGFLMYYGSSRSSLQVFLIVSTCFLYLIAAGLFSRSVWFFDTYTYNKATGGDASESGSGNGSYNINRALYHVNCCNPELDNGWDIFNSLLGWQNTGYYSSVLAYIFYWVFFTILVLLLIHQERYGHLPLIKKKFTDLKPRFFRKKQLDNAEKEQLFNRIDHLAITDEGIVETRATNV